MRLWLSEFFGVELTMLLQISASPGFYDDGDSGPRGNACASFKPLFPIVQGAPPVDGGVAFGRKCYAGLAGSSAAIGGIYAHEMGHLLQQKFIQEQLYDLRNQDQSVVREELHADFVCGYYAAFRKQRQLDWNVVIEADLQFSFGDYEYANPLHHGTPEERKAAVQAGLAYGLASTKRPPAQVANDGLEYVKSLILDQASRPPSC